MQLRFQFLKAANALLYLGPLVAGMSGFGWGMVAWFTAIFVAWLVVLRPEQWPATWTDWRSVAGLVSALTLILSQVALIAVLFAIGRGVGALAGFLPVVHPQVPLALSFMAIPLGRLLWNAEDAADRGIFLDDEAAAASAPRMAAAAAASITPLLQLADDAPDQAVAEAVAKTLATPSADIRLGALAKALEGAKRSHAALRQALILWASEPEIVAPGLVPRAMALAFAMAGRNGDLLRLYVPRALALIAAFPDRVVDFPDAAALRALTRSGPANDTFADLPDHLRADLHDGVVALAIAIEQASAGRSGLPTGLAPR